jgi:hypothetical protein
VIAGTVAAAVGPVVLVSLIDKCRVVALDEKER